MELMSILLKLQEVTSPIRMSIGYTVGGTVRQGIILQVYFKNLTSKSLILGTGRLPSVLSILPLGWSHLMTFRNSTNRDRSSVMRLEPWKRNLPSVKMRMKPLLKSRRYSQNYCQKSGGFFPPFRAYKYRKYFPKSFVKSFEKF